MKVRDLNSIFVDLRSKHPITRERAAMDLRIRVTPPSPAFLHGVEFRKTAEPVGSDVYSGGVSCAVSLDELQEIAARIADLLHASDGASKLGGVAAIHRLMEAQLPSEGQPVRVTRFGNYLRNLLPTQDTLMIRRVTVAMGALARCGGALVGDHVDYETKRAMEWLSSPDTAKRFAAVCVVAELARSAPTLLYAHVGAYLSSMWSALRDQQRFVRDKAADALRACLSLVVERESTWRAQWYYQIYDEAMKGLPSYVTGNALVPSAVSGISKLKSEKVHASLLVLYELVRAAGEFMSRHVRQVTSCVLALKDHKDKYIRRCVCLLLPPLARFFSTPEHLAMREEFLTHSVGLLLYLLKKEPPAERGYIYSVVGDLTYSIGADSFSNYVGQFVPLLFAHLDDASQQREEVEMGDPDVLALASLADEELHPLPEPHSAILDCIAKLAKTLKDSFATALSGIRSSDIVAAQKGAAADGSNDKDSLLDIMIRSSGMLSPSLINALCTVISAIPSLHETIQERVLNVCSHVLARTPFYAPGAQIEEEDEVSRGAYSFASEGASKTKVNNVWRDGVLRADDTAICTTLRTLNVFPFAGRVTVRYALWEFARDSVLPYMDKENISIRREAAKACSGLWARDVASRSGIDGHSTRVADSGNSTKMSGYWMSVRSEVLERLLHVAVADPESWLRYVVLSSLATADDRESVEEKDLDGHYASSRAKLESLYHEPGFSRGRMRHQSIVGQVKPQESSSTAGLDHFLAQTENLQ